MHCGAPHTRSTNLGRSGPTSRRTNATTGVTGVPVTGGGMNERQ
ncbi:expressed unknown protein [Ectocarpus siliculosus]|uniref:Uncharacterized protein n=1 Tax=Ectocarpus siliculosus TaxID=2880 RepID=D7G9F1_ECTSI|nr:expressed unknown protein [Ectocarpus siliculosus]|eukprot:CBJ28291.1 expressed unknown protein [Ectocarpus siliculosus]